MSLILNEPLVLAKTRSQDLKSVIRLNCWGSGIKDVSLIRQLTNVEVICLSCNEITRLEDFAYCPKLKELILRNNKIKNISEILHLQNLPNLTSLWLGENPCAENTHNYRKVVLKALPNLTVLDNIPVTKDELQELEECVNEIYEEIPYESNSSSGSILSNSNTHPKATVVVANSTVSNINESSNDLKHERSPVTQQHSQEQSLLQNNEFIENLPLNDSNNPSLTNRALQQVFKASRCLSSQGSYSSNNISINYNNNNFLPKGGKSRSGNILSAVLCLVKELDYTGCEVVQTALYCRMEETTN